VSAGEAVFQPGTTWTRAGVLLSGTARAFLGSGDGRQLTIRYARQGSFLGNVFPLAGERAPLGIAAVTDCEVLEFDVEVLREIVDRDVEVAILLVRALGQRLEDLYATVAAMAFGTMRERLAGHLLDLAQVDPASGCLVARVTQQQLADSVGTVREVVARELRALREEGTVSTSSGRIDIEDPRRLAAHVGRWATVKTR
jgi:CRP/FNR family transcriptional regulator, cyclic AMP receptor protein